MPGKKPELRFQDIGDTQLQYLFYPGEGPTLIALHAVGFTPWLWHPILSKLDRCRIIAPYFCDHRKTDPEEGGLNWILLAEDLCRLCDELKIDNLNLLGHSMGATVMVMADAMRGNIAQKMLLIEPIFLPQDYYRTQKKIEDHPLAAKSLRRRAYWKSKDEIIAYFKSKPLFQSWDDEMFNLYISHGIKQIGREDFQLTCSPKMEASLFMGGLGYNPWPLLPLIECPVLVVEGEISENRHYIDLKAVTRLLPNATHTIIAGAGHLVPMEKPQIIFELIQSFL